jgi:glycosyltransferase involved in cell wall biosynthesis
MSCHYLGPDRVTQYPLVSVIIPVYNRLQYLRQAISSALEQTHPAVEVVVVDDGSPADPEPIVAQFAERVLFLRTENRRQAAARNTGIAAASGEYLLFLDDDDFLEPDAIENLLKAIGNYPAARWAAGRFWYAGADGKPSSRTHHIVLESGNIYQRLIHSCLMGVPSTVLAEAAAVRDLGGFDDAKKLHMAEDYDLWLSLSKVSPIAAIKDFVTNYRLHATQFTSVNRAPHAMAIIEVLRKHRSLALPADRAEFDRSIAQTYKELGDELYVSLRVDEARDAWRTAIETDHDLAGLSMTLRFCKSRLPRALLRLLRKIAAHARDLHELIRRGSIRPSIDQRSLRPV